MTSGHDDPRLSAYALGDLDDAERAEFERELAAAPELQAEVEAIRRLAGQLGAALRSEPAPEFQEVVVPASEPRRSLSRPSRGRGWIAVLTVAASVLVVVGILAWPRDEVQLSRMSATQVESAPRSEATPRFGGGQAREASTGRDSASPRTEGRVPAESSSADDRRGAVAQQTPATPGLAASQPDSALNETVQPIAPVQSVDEVSREDKQAIAERPVNAVREATPQAPSNATTRIEAGSEALVDRPFQVYGEPAAGHVIGGGGGMGRGGAGPVPNDFSTQGDVLSDSADPQSSQDGATTYEYRDPSRWSEVTRSRQQLGAEAYDTIVENPFRRVSDDPLSTFSIDVDTASYSNVRRFLDQRTLPPRSAVRIEELVNYFRYDYPQPEGEEPFAVHLEVAGCPWAPEHRLVRVALKGREVDPQRRPPSNLVFLVDVSGSMRPDNKLPLVQQGLRMLTERLGEDDRVAIVTYAGNSGVALPSTGGEQKSTILQAIDALEAGGSTNGASGIELAYALAVGHFIKNGTNRVILCTDGDFNVGITDRNELTKLIEQKAASGVFLSVLGFGMGNLKDGTLETLADKGNGVYAYLDTEREAHKVLVEELSGTLVTIAKDVKVQLEFNPGRVAAYRLLGYENRVLAHQDFNDDRKDAGDIGAGHTVTAFYEIVPAGGDGPVPGVDPLKYQAPAEKAAPAKDVADAPVSDELLTVKLRYKQPDGVTSKLLEAPLKDSGHALSAASNEFRFAAAVVEFGLLLRDSAYRGGASLANVQAQAESSLGEDPEGYRREFLRLVEQAKAVGK